MTRPSIRWRFQPNAGPPIAHRRGNTRVPVKSHRAIPVDVSKYPADALVAIRRRRVNFKGERAR